MRAALTAYRLFIVAVDLSVQHAVVDFSGITVSAGTTSVLSRVQLFVRLVLSDRMMNWHVRNGLEEMDLILKNMTLAGSWKRAGWLRAFTGVREDQV